MSDKITSVMGLVDRVDPTMHPDKFKVVLRFGDWRYETWHVWRLTKRKTANKAYADVLTARDESLPCRLSGYLDEWRTSSAQGTQRVITKVEFEEDAMSKKVEEAVKAADKARRDKPVLTIGPGGQPVTDHVESARIFGARSVGLRYVAAGNIEAAEEVAAWILAKDPTRVIWAEEAVKAAAPCASEVNQILNMAEIFYTYLCDGLPQPEQQSIEDEEEPW